MRLDPGPPRSSARRCPRRQAEMFKDAASDALILDDSNELHRPLAPSAGQHVDRVGALHEDSPIEPSLAAGVVDDHDVVSSPRMNSDSRSRAQWALRRRAWTWRRGTRR
jgi:hypothetical protein